MRFLSALLVSCLTSQFVCLPPVFAEDISSATGAILEQPLSPSDPSKTDQNLLNENKESVLHENENTVQENNSSSVSSSIVSPLIIRINEVAWMGSDLSTADEWIEISAIPAVTGAVITEPLNLQGWSVSMRKDTGESVIVNIASNLFIGSGQYLVLSNYPAAQSRLRADPAIVSTALSLPNTKLQLRLRDAVGGLVDEVDDYVGAPFAGANPSSASGLSKATMERIDLRKPGSDPGNWRTATVSMGFDTGAVILGSPGFPTFINTIQSSSSSSVSSQVPSSIRPQPILSELLPDPPEAQEEWIELANTGTDLLDISGWQLRSGSRSFTFPPQTILTSGEHRLFPSSLTGLQLPNSGGEVQLWQGGVMIDHILYTEMPDGVSVGRHDDGSIGPFCVPTAGAVNVVMSPTISLVGFIRGLPNPTSINLEVKALSGSLAGARCSIDYGDGFVSNSCNPPSHAMKRIGHIDIKTTVKDFCGNTMTRSDDVLIVGGSSSKVVSTAPAQKCIPTSASGVMISEFLSAPVTGEDEWIELRNTTDETISLCGWSVDDTVGGSHPYRLDDRSIDSGQFLLLKSAETGIALNNDADVVRLIAPDLHGGTGVLLSIPYQDTQTGESFAQREDGLMIHTPFPTPGSVNRFTAIDTTPGSSPVILSAAMPNPMGVDTWDEWIELTNTTGRPQWLNGWSIEDAAGHRLPLDGRVLAKREVQTIPLYKTSFALTNTVGSIRLIDNQGAIRSVLAWHNAEEGHRVRLPSNCIEETLTGSSLMTDIPGIVFPPLVSDNINIKNYISALIKDKKLVLQKCSDNSESIRSDGLDIALLLLEQGFGIADPIQAGVRHDILSVYEDQARIERRGVWRNLEDGMIVDLWKENRVLDYTVATEDLQIHISPASALLSTGSVISITTNAPADLWVKEDGKPYRRFNGGVFVDADTTLSFLASYSYKTLSGGTIRTSVLSQSYSVKKANYPSCIRISEVYPSPKKGEQEWVELQNICNESMSLMGWMVDDILDGGSKPFVINKPFFISGSGGHVILSGALLPIALNNGGDSVVLISPNGRTHDAMSYLKVSAGRSLALVGDTYCQTIEPTNGMNNICVQTATKVTSKSSKNSSKKMVVGLSMKYLAGILNVTSVNTKNDQFKGLLEGLNRNTIYKNKDSILWSISASFLFIIGLLTLLIGVVLYMKKYRLWQ